MHVTIDPCEWLQSCLVSCAKRDARWLSTIHDLGAFQRLLVLTAVEFKSGITVASDALNTLRSWNKYATRRGRFNAVHLGLVYGGDKAIEREGVNVPPLGSASGRGLAQGPRPACRNRRWASAHAAGLQAADQIMAG